MVVGHENVQGPTIGWAIEDSNGLCLVLLDGKGSFAFFAK